MMTSASQWLPLVTLLLLPLVVMSVDVYVKEGKAGTLTCNPFDKTGSTFQYWDVVYDNTKTTELLYKNQKTSTAEVLDDGWTLYIPSVSAAYYGTYRCAYKNPTDELTYYKVQLRRERTSTFEKYRLPIIVSLVASAAALVLLGLICGVYNWRWERRHGQDAKTLVREEEASASSSARHNPAFFNDGFTDEKGDITIASTHI